VVRGVFMYETLHTLHTTQVYPPGYNPLSKYRNRQLKQFLAYVPIFIAAYLVIIVETHALTHIHNVSPRNPVSMKSSKIVGITFTSDTFSHTSDTVIHTELTNYQNLQKNLVSKESVIRFKFESS
jgi:hypothetical protein